MESTISRRALLGGCALGIAAVSGGCLGVGAVSGKRTEFERTVEMATGYLTVDTHSGDVRVSRAEDEAVHIRGTKRTPPLGNSEDVGITTTRDGDHLHISTDSGRSLFGSGSVSLTVAVPVGVMVGAVSTKNGTVDVRDVSGDAHLRSKNGTVQASGIEGFVSLSSKNGDISARSVTGLAGAKTKNGTVDVEVPAIDGAVSMTSKNGAITATLSPNLNATVLASSKNGDLTVNGLPLQTRRIGNRSVRGTLGDGTHRLTIETKNGAITLDRLR